MKKVKVLDCTLRDGGYCNEWKFGKENIIKILESLNTANVDYIECGFLSTLARKEQEKSIYSTIEEISELIPEKARNIKHLVMINYGEYDAEQLSPKENYRIDGIRVAFHKKNWHEAVNVCSKIKKKGYQVFAQPMVSTNYSEEEFRDLINALNQIHLDAFYIVDSFGTMKHDDLLEYVRIADSNLKPSICLGFHAHNNLQLAYANAQLFIGLPLNRQLIVDVTIHGMGRGAGNLNAELFLDYLNAKNEGHYFVKPVLSLMDEIISGFYEKKPWGYNLPNYLAAVHCAHPNYANYLSQKKTLTIEAIDEIFRLMDSEKKTEYDDKYIENLYIKYLSKKSKEKLSYDKLRNEIEGRPVLLIAPGISSVVQKDKIISFIKANHPLVISVNYNYSYYESNYIFISNMRRFRQLISELYYKAIITSNIVSDEVYTTVDYQELLNPIHGVKDNAGLMAIQLLINLNASVIYIAGFDGFSYNSRNNYESDSMISTNTIEMIELINKGLSQALHDYGNKCNLFSLTHFTNLPNSNRIKNLYLE